MSPTQAQAQAEPRKSLIGASKKPAKKGVSVLKGQVMGNANVLTLKAPIRTAADDIHKYFFIVFLRK